MAAILNSFGKLRNRAWLVLVIGALSINICATSLGHTNAGAPGRSALVTANSRWRQDFATRPRIARLSCHAGIKMPAPASL